MTAFTQNKAALTRDYHPNSSLIVAGWVPLAEDETMLRAKSRTRTHPPRVYASERSAVRFSPIDKAVPLFAVLKAGK